MLLMNIFSVHMVQMRDKIKILAFHVTHIMAHTSPR